MEKILIIEDEELIRDSIANYLDEEGYQSITADNGIEGIKIAKDLNPDLIICDIKMPEMDGHQVLQTLRTDSRTSTIPFIFLSAMVDKNDLRKGMMLGADDYITKPFRPEDLLNSIKTRLEKYAELKKKMDTLKDSIAHTLPHELQTPLVTIIGYSEMLSERFKDGQDEEAFEFSQQIHQAGLRLNRLIRNFIFYEKLQLMSLDPSSKELAGGVCDINKKMIEESSNKIAARYNRIGDLHITVKHSAIKIPRTYLQLLMEELTDNALKFSEPGSKVKISGQVNENSYNLIFSDSGRGMTDEQLANIGAYFQFEREKYEQQGMGLGLAISTKIVELYKGNIKTESEYGEFTKISISLPLP